MEASLVFVLAAAIRAAGLGEEALHDELYNYLAAKNQLAHGTLALVTGGAPYMRGALFTHVVAQCMALFGDALWVARLPALVAGSLVAMLTFVWTAAVANRWAGWTAAILVCVDPLLVQLSGIVRFYSFQHLALLSGAVIVYFFVANPRTRGLAALAGTAAATVLLGVAVQLQPVSLIGIGGLALFVAGVRGASGLRSLEPERRRRAAFAAGGLTIVLAIIVVTGTTWVEWAVRMATYADLWAASNMGNVRYYYAILYDHFAPFWALFPLLLILALSWRPRLTALCACVFIAAMVIHSLMAWKAERYFSYALPFFFVIIGVGLSRAVPALYRFVDGLLQRQGGTLGRANVRTVLATALLTAIVVFGATGNRAFLLTGRLVTRDHSRSFPLMGARDGGLSWSRFAAAVAPMIDSVDVVVSSDDVKALHYLGKLDYDFSPDHLYTINGRRPEFSIDRRTNAPVVQSAAAMEIITQCHDSGILVVQRMSLNERRREAVDYVASVARPVPVPRSWGILAYRWSNVANGNDPAPARCSIVQQTWDSTDKQTESS